MLLPTTWVVTEYVLEESQVLFTWNKRCDMTFRVVRNCNAMWEKLNGGMIIVKKTYRTKMKYGDKDSGFLEESRQEISKFMCNQLWFSNRTNKKI